MLEPAVTVTDFFLAILNAAFAVVILSARPSPIRWHFVLFFVSIAVSAFAGALSHGFYPAGLTGAALWRLTLLSLGVTSAATFLIATDLTFGNRRSVFFAIAVVAVIAYAGYVLFVQSSFGVALAFYLPSALFMFCGFALLIGRSPRIGWLGATGMILTFVAAYVQHARIAIHRTYFDHNATYHAVQAAGLLLIFLAARELVSAPATSAATHYNS